eukprot:1664024-Amphidinium_carterae.1
MQLALEMVDTVKKDKQRAKFVSLALKKYTREQVLDYNGKISTFASSEIDFAKASIPVLVDNGHFELGMVFGEVKSVLDMPRLALAVCQASKPAIFRTWLWQQVFKGKSPADNLIVVLFGESIGREGARQPNVKDVIADLSMLCTHRPGVDVNAPKNAKTRLDRAKDTLAAIWEAEIMANTTLADNATLVNLPSMIPQPR